MTAYRIAKILVVIKFGGFSPTLFLTLLADLNLVVWYSMTICTCTQKKNLADFNLVVEKHTAKPPNFPAIRYFS